MKLWSILKYCQANTKPVIRRHVYHEYVYYEWWEKQVVAALLYKYKEIRCTYLAWSLRQRELAKGLYDGVAEPGILLLKKLLLEKWGIICYLQE